MNEENIKKQAKAILDKFAKALESVKTGEARVERVQERRIEGGETAKISKDLFFEKAPRKKDDCIEAEKGAWV